MPMTPHSPPWDVLLLGGHSGTGKSTVAGRLARRYRMAWLMADDLRLALQRSRAVLPTPEATAALRFHATPGWWRHAPERLRVALIADAEALSPALEVVIENHVDQHLPVVLEVPPAGAGAPVAAGDTKMAARPPAPTGTPEAPEDPVFGHLGVPAVDALEDTIQCYRCGRWFRSLATHVWRAHGITTDAYLAVFEQRSAMLRGRWLRLETRLSPRWQASQQAMGRRQAARRQGW